MYLPSVDGLQVVRLHSVRVPVQFGEGGEGDGGEGEGGGGDGDGGDGVGGGGDGDGGGGDGDGIISGGDGGGLSASDATHVTLQPVSSVGQSTADCVF